MGITGRIPDGHIVIQRARKEAEGYLENYGINITGAILTERIANYIHAHTLYGNYRPLGVTMTVASHDNGKSYLY